MKRAGRIGFGAVTVFLILVTAFCCAGTVMSRTDLSRGETENYYRAEEKRLVSEARAFLRARGLADSGVMLTHITEADGSRIYTMTVHHAEIDRMSEEERLGLLEELESFSLENPGISFFHKFYIDD